MKNRVLMFMAVLLALAGGVMPLAGTAQAQGGTVWTGEYYNNTFLFEPKAATRQEGAVAFDWGNGSPMPGVNADGFSVRWVTDPYFPAGTYRFWALADDNIRVTIGFSYTPQIDTFGQNKVGQLVSADVTLTEGIHHVQVDYREETGTAYAFVTWANLATNPTGPNFPQTPSLVNVNTAAWTAQYYGNTALSGSPTLIQSENSPSKNWGGGSPVGSIPADNFSARWTSVQTLDAGQYTVSVRADDGIRVFVDGVAVINEWHGATGQTYTATLNLGAGAHNFMIEYYEAAGEAFMEFSLLRQGFSVPPPSGVQTGTTATVTGAFRLNVRNGPGANFAILTKINRNETYPVTGTNEARSWYQINVNSVVGWVSGRFVTIQGNQNVPVTSGSPTVSQPTDTGFSATALDTVNIRSLPSTSGNILSKLPRGLTASVIGRNSNNTWWQINYQGIVGWVSAVYAELQPGADVGRIPITA